MGGFYAPSINAEDQVRMAKSEKKQAELSRLGVKNKFSPKLVGGGFLLITLYLFIAFISYLFTWELDQDKARLSLLFESHLIYNWSGHLGALISRYFFEYGFGVPSFMFIYLAFKTGINKITGTPIRQLVPTYRRVLIFIIWTSILFAFIFKSFPFYWGGAFGGAVIYWLNHLMGTAGIIVLLLFLLFGLLIWAQNPKPQDWSSAELKDRVQFKKLVKGAKELGRFLWPIPTESTQKDSTNRQTADTNERTTKTLGSKRFNHFKVIENEAKQADTTREQEAQTTRKALESYNLNPTFNLPDFESPTLDLLENYDSKKPAINRTELEANKQQIIETLLNYKIEVIRIQAVVGSTVTLYEVVLEPSVPTTRIENLENDIALHLAFLKPRIIAPIPGKGTIGIEIPNSTTQIVSLRAVLSSAKYQEAKMDLPIALGKSISNEVFVVDLAKMPHLLLAGAMVEDKSIGINTLIMSLLYKKHPAQLKFVLIDSKKGEFSLYNQLSHHYLGHLRKEKEALVTGTSEVVATLNSLIIEMDNRYNWLKKAGVRTIKEYNQKLGERRLDSDEGHRFLPYLLLVIAELADLIGTAGKAVELLIGHLAGLAPTVGIHLVIATQHPSVAVITGAVKTHFSTRLVFKVTSKVDSEAILGTGGAEQLIGRGDLLFSTGGETIRLQSAFVSTPEIEQVLAYIRKQQAYPSPFYLPARGFRE